MEKYWNVHSVHVSEDLLASSVSLRVTTPWTVKLAEFWRHMRVLTQLKALDRKKRKSRGCYHFLNKTKKQHTLVNHSHNCPYGWILIGLQSKKRANLHWACRWPACNIKVKDCSLKMFLQICFYRCCDTYLNMRVSKSKIGETHVYRCFLPPNPVNCARSL